MRARRTGRAVQPAIPALTLLQVVIGIQASDERDRLPEGDERSLPGCGVAFDSACAWALSDCAVNSAAWHLRHASTPAYSEATIAASSSGSRQHRRLNIL